MQLIRTVRRVSLIVSIVMLGVASVGIVLMFVKFAFFTPGPGRIPLAAGAVGFLSFSVVGLLFQVRRLRALRSQRREAPR
jgi:hypothetical protein